MSAGERIERTTGGLDYGRRWECPACGALSTRVYRCSECQKDLAEEAETAARMEGES